MTLTGYVRIRCQNDIRLEITGNLRNFLNQFFPDLVKVYVYVFQDQPDYKKAQEIFAVLVSKDTDNQLAYAHYDGLIYSMIKLGEKSDTVF